MNDNIIIEEREMSEFEFARMNKGFNEQTLESGNPIEVSERFGFIAVEDKKFIGCCSGLAYKQVDTYGDWFFITDLFVDSQYRSHGLGSKLLQKIEAKVKNLGVKHVYTWTAGYEAPEFYEKQGYQIFTELEVWYHTGHNRVGLRKSL